MMRGWMATAVLLLLALLVNNGVELTWSLSLNTNNSREASSRRALLRQGRAAFLLSTAGSQFFSSAPAPAHAGSLLDEFGADPTKIQQKEVPAPPVAVPTVRKGDQAIDPTLRASYYYPTAKKRYLPRILKVSNSIGDAAQSIQQDEWDKLEDFFKLADNAVLPMKLYVSSLDGQGLGMSNSYAQKMKQESGVYEKQVLILKQALAQQNKEVALQAVENMGVAITQYRQVGRLTDDDGNIPSVDEMRRMAMRKPTVSVTSLSSR